MQVKPRRPVPADFADKAKTLTVNAMMKHYDASRGTVKRWAAKTGVEPCKTCVYVSRRQFPDDFLTRGAGKSIRQIVQEYGVHRSTAQNWLKLSGLRPVWENNGRRPIPDDFIEVARTSLRAELIRRYRASSETVERWIKETGVHVRKGGLGPRGGFVPNLGQMGQVHKVRINSLAIKTICDDAADTLRRERFPVNRCNDKGGFDPQGKFWRVGWSVLTADELLARASKYQRVAA